MSHFHHLQSIKFKLNLLNLRNLDVFNLPGEFFIRYHIATGTGKRIRVDSQVLPSMSSLELTTGSNRITELLEKRSIVFELRWRKPKPMFKCFAKSKLLGKAEVAWKDIVRPDGAPMERWISFVIACKGVSLDVKPPALLVRIEASLSESMMEKSLRRSEINGRHEECGCRDCSQWIGSEEDLFHAAATALDIV